MTATSRALAWIWLIFVFVTTVGLLVWGNVAWAATGWSSADNTGWPLLGGLDIVAGIFVLVILAFITVLAFEEVV